MLEMREIKNNCSYKAKVDEYGRLHVLDMSGSYPMTSVTNSVDWLIPFLMQEFKINYTPIVLLYGTDAEVAQYDPSTKHFAIIRGGVLLDNAYYTEMQYLYSRQRGF